MVIDIARLTGLPLFRGVPSRVPVALAKRARLRSFATDQTIFLAGREARGWYVILEGRVRVVRSDGTRQHVIHTEGVGGTLGEVPLFAGGGNPATAIAAEPTVCALFARADIESAMTECAALGMLLLQRLALRVRALVERLDDRSARSVTSRLAQYLLDRPTIGSSNRLSLGTTQVALAEELGTVREVVSRELRLLADRELIQPLGGGRFEVLDRASLRLVAAR